MKTANEIRATPVDIHAAIARAHADRAEYLGFAVARLSSLIRRMMAKARPNSRRMPHKGVWA